jgi:hypothetical protein
VAEELETVFRVAALLEPAVDGGTRADFPAVGRSVVVDVINGEEFSFSLAAAGTPIPIR